MKDKLQEITKRAMEQIDAAEEMSALNDVRVAVLGKKGELTAVLKSMKDVKPEDRPAVGQLVNETRSAIEEKLAEAKERMEEAELDHRLKSEVIDVTLPAKKAKIGHLHPNTNVLQEVEDIFVGMGYEVVEGPEVEYDYYNFEALNIPANHPAKDEQDTFYINKDILLRTQTSPVQVRVMEKGKLPIRMIAPGRVFRSDEVDATHSPSFHQIEGMVIDKNITFADLKGTLQEFVKQLFGGIGKNFMNPALAARAFLFSWPVIMTTWVQPGDWAPLFGSSADAVTSATPLASLHQSALPAESLMSLFLGKTGGTGIGGKILAGMNSNNWFDLEHPWYSIGLVAYIVMVIFFAYFYTSITFNPLEVADNMKKQGGFIPGIRPGKPTVDYLTKMLNYIIFIGAAGLTIVAVIPFFFNGVFGANVSFGGTSIIIIVGVILETLKQIESMMLVRNYKGFLDN